MKSSRPYNAFSPSTRDSICGGVGEGMGRIASSTDNPVNSQEVKSNQHPFKYYLLVTFSNQ